MAFGERVEVSCSQCQRRYAVADHKVAGRRRQSRCRCGNVLVFDGRHLGSPAAEPLDEQMTDCRDSDGPDARGEALRTSDGSLVSGDARARRSTPPPKPARRPTPSPDQPDSRAIGRIRLRSDSSSSGALLESTDSEAAPSARGASESKGVRAAAYRVGRGPSPSRTWASAIGNVLSTVTAPPPPSPHAVDETGSLADGSAPATRPKAPSATFVPETSESPESPRDLHEAFDTLGADLDKIADRYRPAWENTPGVPPSRRVTAPGENPEVVVHYPPEWQPPPSQRKRLRASWDSPPPAASIAAASSVRSLVAQTDDAEAFIAQAEATLGDAKLQAAPRDQNDDEADHRDGAPAPSAKRIGDGTATTPSALGFDSTAPAAYSRRPLTLPSRNRAGLWAAAGLAAMAVIGIVWRQRAPDSPGGSAAPAGDMASPAAADQPAMVVPTGLPTEEQSPPPNIASTGESEASSPLDQLVAPTSESEPAKSEKAEPGADADADARAPSATAPGQLRDREGRATPAPTRHQPAEERDELAPRTANEASRLPTHETPPKVGPDTQQVAQALAAAASRASGCREANGPAGSGSVRVLLNPVGGVLNATALGAYQGTSVGRCVENVFRRARTQPFSGTSLSTVYPFSIPEK